MHMQVKNLELKNSPLQKVLVIIGPTASGKTALAIRLARKFGGEIVSADSRQVYRGMDIGTGKTPRDTNAKIKYEKITDARSRTAGYSSRGRNIRPEIGLPSGLSPPLRSGLTFIPTAERRGILPEIIKKRRNSPHGTMGLPRIDGYCYVALWTVNPFAAIRTSAHIRTDSTFYVSRDIRQPCPAIPANNLFNHRIMRFCTDNFYSHDEPPCSRARTEITLYASLSTRQHVRMHSQAQYTASTSLKSPGSGASKDTVLPLGNAKLKRTACSRNRSFARCGIYIFAPYSVSPAIGCPAVAACTRI